MLQVFMKRGMVHAYSCNFLSIIIVIERGVAQAKEKLNLLPQSLFKYRTYRLSLEIAPRPYRGYMKVF